ncbi:MAG: Arm DNA-binding domain-containing protein [Pseudomonadales bacterium]
MASIRSRYGKLVVDFYYMGIRCRETTNLTDTPANRKKLEKVIEKMEAEIVLGLFNYAKYFPKSDKAAQRLNAINLIILTTISMRSNSPKRIFNHSH